MAHELNAARWPKLHQALHGYADGHRELALSITLTPRDQRTLLALSDISGPGARLEDEGYLTGYPLQESGFYALARTWLAPEMPRPGCVWTHTLLIDFTDLAMLETLEGLADLFRRPAGLAAAKDYEQPRHLSADYIPSPSVGVSPSWARRVLAALYGSPASRIIVMRPTTDGEKAALSIWSQQWPRLRRNFRFCTFTAGDRSIDNASFDLQMLPSRDRSVRSRFAAVLDAAAMTVKDDEWLDDAVSDLLLPGRTDLRSFLRKVGADLEGGRDVFRSLCSLHRMIQGFELEPDAVHDAIVLFQNELARQEARTARAIIATAALQQVERLDDFSFKFLWDNLQLVEPAALAAAAVRVGRVVWSRDPERLVALQDDERGLRRIMDETLAQLQVSELVEGLSRAPAGRQLALARRPELITEPLFWMTLEDVDVAFQTAKARNEESAAVSALLAARRTDLASRAAREFGSLHVLDALSGMPASSAQELSVWAAAAAADPAAVANFLATRPSVPKLILYLLANVMPPDAVPNDYGTDPWLVASRSAEQTLDERHTVYLAAYLLTRALGSRSRSAAELAQLSFETVHSAAAANLLSDSDWRLLEHRLPRSIFWFDWDHCQRLRAAVADLFISRDLSPSLFVRLTLDDWLFSALAEEAARSRRGRSYLDRVRYSLREDRDEAFAARIRLIDNLVD